MHERVQRWNGFIPVSPEPPSTSAFPQLNKGSLETAFWDRRLDEEVVRLISSRTSSTAVLSICGWETLDSQQVDHWLQAAIAVVLFGCTGREVVSGVCGCRG